MFTTLHRRLLSVVVSSLAFATVPISALATHSWGSYHWARTGNPFILQLGDNVSIGWDAYLAEAIDDWTRSGVLDITKVAGGAGDPRKCRPTTGRVEVCNARYGNNGWLGVAQIWVSGPHITKSIVKLNDSYFSTSTYNKPEWRRFVMCQEIGHTFGLDHQDEIFSNGNLGSCMDYTSDPDGPLSNEHPNTHDYDQLVTIYGHGDSTNTVAQTTAGAKAPPAMDEIDFAERGQWGKRIRSKNKGRTELHELDFGGGHKVFTFVIWALERDRTPR